MNTLVLRHNGHEAHVPYELPDSFQFDCFIPLEGICAATADPRSDEIDILEVRHPDGSFMSGSGYPAAVLEQAGDVCAVFERALPGDLNGQERWNRHAPREDVLALSTIAEMAILESDLHTAWCRLPEPLRPSSCAPPDPRDPNESHAHHALQRFIEQTLVPRAQDMATAAAKRREAEWRQEKVAEAREIHASRMTDLAIDIAKEGA